MLRGIVLMMRAPDEDWCPLCAKSIRRGGRMVFHPASETLPETFSLHRRCYDNLKRYCTALASHVAVRGFISNT